MTDSDPIERLRTGISGFDQVALGGLPADRSTFIGGTAGSGKTLFAVEFLARGILQFGEPGVFITFEETAQDIRRNYASLGFLTDIAITLSYYEQAGEIQRAVAVVQTSGSAHDARVRQVTVDGDGMHVTEPIPGMTNLPPGAPVYISPDRSPGFPGSQGPQPDG